MSMQRLSMAQIRKLLLERFPPQSEREQVYGSLILVQAERLAELEKIVAQVATVTTALADKASPAGRAPTPPADPNEPPRDATPFPAGVADRAGVAGGVSAQAPAPDAPAPDVGSSGPLNPSPIPTKRNGGKAKEAQG